METKGSLTGSQESAIGPYPEPVESSSHSHNMFKIHSNIIIPT
jgi:hypothetical protein